MNYYRLIIVGFLSVVAAYAAVFLYRYHFYEDFGNGFIVGDWLINYEDGGFKRRGLSGTIMFALQDITGLELSPLVLLFQLMSFFCFIGLFILILWNRKHDWLYLSLVLSPLTFLSYLNDYGYLGRKEFLLFLVFSIFLFYLQKGKLSKAGEFVIMTLIFTGTLFHELFFFYIPYFIIARYLLLNNFSKINSLIYLCTALIPVAAITIFGHQIDEGNSIAILQSRGFSIAEHNIYAESVIMDSIGQIREHSTQYLLYLVVWIAGLIHFGYFIKVRMPQHLKTFYSVLPLAFLFTVPMFILAVDWGRWIQIHFMLLLMLITVLIPTNTDQPRNSMSTQTISFKDSKYLLIVLLMFCWGMKHVYTGFYPGGTVRYLYSLAFG